jgi:uncharacterized membrane protein
MKRLVWTATLVLAAIGVAAATRRTLHLFAPSPAPPGFSEAAAMDAVFAGHPLLTLIHIVPGVLFMLLGPLQFVRTLRAQRPALHRWTGRVFLAAGAIIAVSALVMSPQMAIGGANETAATMVFAVFFLVALGKAFGAIRSRQIARHREWMIRAFAIGLAVATVRPIVGAFFATSRLTHLTPHEFFGTAFWLGFTAHLMAAEAWIHRTRESAANPAAAP